MGMLSDVGKKQTYKKFDKSKYDKKANEEKNDERSKKIIEQFFDESEKTGSFIDERWTKEMLEPKSMVTGKDYKGYNVLYLATRMAQDDMKDNRFFTIDHLRDKLQKETDEFLKIKKGSEGTVIKFFRVQDAEDYYKKKIKTLTNEDDKKKYETALEKVIKKNETSLSRVNLVFKGYHNVFNGSQVENFDKAFPLPEKEESTNKEINKDKYISYLIKSIVETNENVEIVTKKAYSTKNSGLEFGGAYASRGTKFDVDEEGNVEKSVYNKITIPPIEDFKNDKHYLATLLHETSHTLREIGSTAKAMDKYDLTQKQAYAMEEIQAELTAGMTMIRLGLDTKSDNPEENIFGTNKDYIKGWSNELKGKENIKEIFEGFSEESIKRSNLLVEKVKKYEKEYPFEKFLEEIGEIEKSPKKEVVNENIEKSVEKPIEEKPKEDKKIKEVEEKVVEQFTVKQVDIRALIKKNANFNLEVVDDNVDSKELSKALLIKDLETERNSERPFVNTVEDYELKADVSLLKKKFDLDKKERSATDIHLSENAIECLVQTVGDFSNKQFALNVPTLVVREEDVANYYQMRTMDKEIDLDYEELVSIDDDEKFMEEYEKYEEEYMEVLEKKAKAIVSRLATTNKDFDTIEDKLNDVNKKMSCIKISGTENMLAIEKSAKDFEFIVANVEKYNIDYCMNFVEKEDKKDFSKKINEELKTLNENLEKNIKDKNLDFDEINTLLKEERKDFREKVDTYIDETPKKSFDKVLGKDKTKEVVKEVEKTNEKPKKVEKTIDEKSDREIEL